MPFTARIFMTLAGTAVLLCLEIQYRISLGPAMIYDYKKKGKSVPLHARGAERVPGI